MALQQQYDTAYNRWKDGINDAQVWYPHYEYPASTEDWAYMYMDGGSVFNIVFTGKNLGGVSITSKKPFSITFNSDK